MGDVQERYKNIKENIRASYWDEHDFEKCKSICEEYLTLLNNDEVSENTNDRWFYYFYVVKYHIKKNDLKQALEYGEKMLKCDTNDKDYFRSIWQMANCYRDIDKDKALKLYDECIVYCSQHNLEDNLPNILHSKAILTNNVVDMMTAIELYKIPFRKGFTKSEHEIRLINKSLNCAYRDLCKIYLNQCNFILAQLYAEKIEDMCMKQNLVDEIIQMSKC